MDRPSYPPRSRRIRQRRRQSRCRGCSLGRRANRAGSTEPNDPPSVRRTTTRCPGRVAACLEGLVGYTAERVVAGCALTGVARRHRLISELRPILRLSRDQPVLHASSTESSPAGNPLDTLERYFESWRGRVQHGAVGTFLSLLGNGLHNVVGNLAEQWLGEDVSIESIEGLDRQTISVFVSPKIADGDRVNAVNVLGSRVEMETEADDDTLFAVDPVPYPPPRLRRLARSGRSRCAMSSHKAAHHPISLVCSAIPSSGGPSNSSS